MNEMFGAGFNGFLGGGGMWRNDDYYMHYGGGWSRDYVCTLYINWTMNTHAQIRTETRTGYGCELKLGVFACGTAVARYYEVEEPIYQEDAEGNRRVVGYNKRWEKDVREYVDSVQFSLVTGSAGPHWQEGQLLALPDGSPAAWSLPGDASDWTQNCAHTAAAHARRARGIAVTSPFACAARVRQPLLLVGGLRLASGCSRPPTPRVRRRDALF